MRRISEPTRRSAMVDTRPAFGPGGPARGARSCSVRSSADMSRTMPQTGGGKLPALARFKLILEYAGTRYRGWQVQKNARTVQGEILAVVGRLSGRHDFDLQGSGRTDAGVHALAQAAHLDLETRLAPQALQYALNDALPSDINVLSVEKVSRRFHARHSAEGRSYLY